MQWNIIQSFKKDIRILNDMNNICGIVSSIMVKNDVFFFFSLCEKKMRVHIEKQKAIRKSSNWGYL